MPKIRVSKNNKLWCQLCQMPPLDHWPNRPQQFEYENSQVVAHIMELQQTNIRHAVSLLNQAKKSGVILFNRETKLWKGNELWEP